MKKPNVLLLSSCLALLSAASTYAQTWVGGSGGNVFNVANNWSPSGVPAPNANLVFGAVSNANANVGFNTLPYSATSLTFNGTTYPHYFLNGFGGTLSIGAGGITLAATGNTTSSSNVDFNNSLPIALTADQTWTTNGPTGGNLTVNSNISGANALTKDGTGFLALNGSNSSFTGSVTVAAGTLYLGQSNNVGTSPTSTLTLQSGATLGTTFSSASVSNNITFTSGATLGDSGGSRLDLSGPITLGSATTTMNIGSHGEIKIGGTLTGPSNTALTVHSDGTGIAILSGTQSNIASMTADNAAIAFGNTGSLPTTSIQATNGGYVSVVNTNPGISSTVPAPLDTAVLDLIQGANRTAFNGVIGFDTGDQSTSPHIFATNIDLTGFTAGNVRIGSATSAILTGPITPVAQSYDFGGFAGRGGFLAVQSILADHDGTTGVSVVTPSASGGAPQSGLGLILQGSNTFTGDISVSYSSVLLDSAHAAGLGAGNFSLGAYSYMGYTESAGYADFAAFKSHLTGSTSTSILGFDTHATLAAALTGSDPSVIVARTVSDAIDLSLLGPIYLGTVSGATLTGTITAPTADHTLRLVNLGDFAKLTVSSTLASGNVNAVVAGMPGSNGAVVLTGTNTYANGTSLQGGSLLVSNGSALGAGAITVLTSGAFGNSGSAIALGASSGSVTLDNNISVTDNLQIGTGSTDNNNVFTAGTTALTLNGTISDVDVSHHGRLYLTGPTTLNGTNTYSGGTYVEADTTVNSNTGLGTSFVDIGYNATLTFTSANPVIGGGSLADASQFLGSNAGSGTIHLATNSALTINQTSSSTFSGQIIGTNAALIKNGGGQLNLTGDNAGQFTGGTTIGNGTLAIGNGSATATTFGGNVALNGGNLAFQPAANTTISYNGSITTASGTGSVSINGNSLGTLSVTGGTSTFTGNTNVNSGTLQITANAIWSSVSNTNINGGAKLQLDGNQTIQNLNASGNVVITNAGTALTVNSANSTTSSGVISGNGGLAKTGANTLTLGGANTYGGTTTISAGTLQIGNGASGSITSSSIVNNATLVFNRSNADTYGGAISGSGNVTKQNSGNLTLSGTNSYAGATNVNGGTLFVNGSLTSSAVNVGSGATLGGSGSLSNGATFQSGSHLAPGNSPGTLTFTNGLTLLSGAILDFQLGTSSDKVVVSSGTLTGPAGNNALTLNLSDAGGFAAGTYTLFDFSTGGTIPSSFDATDFTIGTTISGFSSSLALSGNTLVLTATAIPEPSTYAVIAGMLGLGVAVWRRRRSAGRRC